MPGMDTASDAADRADDADDSARTDRALSDLARAPARPDARARDAAAADRGAAARDQLIRQATRIFAAKGFAGASTREICEAAGVNVASIHYYFGDKEGLYREVLLRPIGQMTGQFGEFGRTEVPFEVLIRGMLGAFVLMGLKDEPYELDVTRLHMREMIEPSPVFREVVRQSIVPQHDALAATLAHHCGLARPDADIHQLAFAMFAMASDYCMSREFMTMLAPQLLAQPRAAEHIVERLAGYCVALLEHEKERRQAGARGGAGRPTTRPRAAPKRAKPAKRPPGGRARRG